MRRFPLRAYFFASLLCAFSAHVMAETHKAETHSAEEHAQEKSGADTKAPAAAHSEEKHDDTKSPASKSTDTSAAEAKHTDTKNSEIKNPEIKNPETKSTATKNAEAPAKENANKSRAASDNKPAKNLPSDVRVLIDVSGSMKQTDPKNLRKPALDLIVRLLPDKSRAGVWTFGNSVNMLVPLRNVDESWRKQAAPKANEINSIALYTNIGKALDEVTFDRKKLSGEYNTHIVLLTDGVVDISKDAVDNSKERQRIISDIIPQLKSAGYIVHTIALSENADVDLLKKISVATDGVFTTAVSADQLMTVFLKIFDQAVPAERVPLDNNGFLVDGSIKEFTALIFRKSPEEKTVIVAPDGKEYSSTDPKNNVNWYRTDKYDLITAESPKTGQWKIKTGIAPQSRVTVVSNLQLTVDPLKNNLHINDNLMVNYSFQENGKTITNKDFLGLLEANAKISKEGSAEPSELSFSSSTPPSDGIYHQAISAFAEKGDYEVHLYVDGKTFKREFKHSLNVRDSMLVIEKNNTTAEDGSVTHKYKVSTDEKMVDVKKMKVTLTVRASKEEPVEHQLTLVEPNTWGFEFTPEHAGDYNIEVNALGDYLDGNKLDETVNIDRFSYAPKVVEKKEEPQHKEEPPKKEEAPKKEEPVAEAHEKPEKEAEEKPKSETPNWILYAGIGVGNLLLAGLIYLIYLKMSGGGSKDELDEIEKTLDMKPVSKPAKAPEKPVEKTAIDLSEEEPLTIPINEESAMDNLFPLDNMEDSSGADENNL